MSNKERPIAIQEYLAMLKSVSLAEVLGGYVISDRLTTSNNSAALQTGAKAALSPLHMFVNSHTDIKSWTIVCPPLVGLEVQHFFHLAAPSKKYCDDIIDNNADYRDTQRDWRALYKPENDKLRMAHEQIPGWKIFEQRRLDIVRHIAEGFNNITPKHSALRPIIRIDHNTVDDSRKWVFDELSPQMLECVQSQVECGRHELLLPMLGPLFVAAFSPQITKSWGERVNFELTPTDLGRTQNMGATQILPLTIAHADTLFESDVMKLFDPIGQV